MTLFSHWFFLTKKLEFFNKLLQRFIISLISNQFADLIQKRNINGALNLIRSNMVGGVVQLNEVIRSLVEKHPEPV